MGGKLTFPGQNIISQVQGEYSIMTTAVRSTSAYSVPHARLGSYSEIMSSILKTTYEGIRYLDNAMESNESSVINNNKIACISGWSTGKSQLRMEDEGRARAAHTKRSPNKRMSHTTQSTVSLESRKSSLRVR